MSSSKLSRHSRKGTDLLLHPFATQIINIARPPREVLAHVRFIARVAAGLEPEFVNSPEPPDHYEIPSLGEDTDEEEYHQSIAEYIYALTNDLNRLEAIQIYLSFTNFLSKELAENSIAEEEWIKYHYSNHIMTMMSIYDTSLSLFNATARFNIKQSSGFDRAIRNRIKGDKKYEEIRLCLDSIKDKVGQHRNPRNSFVHESKNPYHFELLRISTIEIYNLWSQTLNREGEYTTHKRAVETKQIAIKELIRELSGEMENLYSLILTLFSALWPIYEHNLMNLRQHE